MIGQSRVERVHFCDGRAEPCDDVRLVRAGLEQGRAEIGEGVHASVYRRNRRKLTKPHKTEKVRRRVAFGPLSGREDSNLRPLDPQSSALTRLRYAPNRLGTEAPNRPQSYSFPPDSQVRSSQGRSLLVYCVVPWGKRASYSSARKPTRTRFFVTRTGRFTSLPSAASKRVSSRSVAASIFAFPIAR